MTHYHYCKTQQFSMATHPSNILNCGGDSYAKQIRLEDTAIQLALIILAVGKLIKDIAQAYVIIKKANQKDQLISQSF